jgi:hypothetical protein
MHSDRQTLCLQINRRCTLALFIFFILTYSKEISLTFGGVVMIITAGAYIPQQITSIESQVESLRRKIQELRMDVVRTESDIRILD